MDGPAAAARDDLAFMKALVEGAGRSQMTGGGVFVLCGTLYGVQALVQWVDLQGLIRLSPGANALLGLGPTVALAALLPWWLWRRRRAAPTGSAARAVQAAFMAVGIANLALVAVFGWVARREHSLIIIELFPPVVFALQGAAWLIAYLMRRRLWLGGIAAGWLTTAIGLGLLAGTPTYVLVAALGLFAWMVAPGVAMIRLARGAA